LLYFTCGHCHYAQPMFQFSSFEIDRREPCCVWGVPCRICGFEGKSRVPEEVWRELISAPTSVCVSECESAPSLLPTITRHNLN